LGRVRRGEIPGLGGAIHSLGGAIHSQGLYSTPKHRSTGPAFDYGKGSSGACGSDSE
jgi:hypothetical protein